ncbi:MAG: glycosyltransferase family 2 protein [Bryobacterales bacterium]|nr:glycosyltransferase family 2 protein [Bryobacterales bacterium]
MSNPLVTIGIPCFNCERYLPLLMRSIRAQTYGNWEVVAIDDGSNDGTRDILQAMEGPRVRVVLDNQNRGLSYRLNQIADLARGELVARTDADDMLLPARIERQVEAFQEDPSTDVVSAGCYVVDNRNRLRGVRRIPELARTAREVMLRNGPSHPTVMTTRAWAQNNRYRCVSRRGEDLDLWIRTIEQSRVRYLPEPLHVIREDTRFDGAKYQSTIRDHQQVVCSYLKEIGDPWFTITVRTRLLARACGYRAGHLLGVANAMAALRNTPLPEEEVRKVEHILSEFSITDDAVKSGTH